MKFNFLAFDPLIEGQPEACVANIKSLIFLMRLICLGRKFGKKRSISGKLIKDVHMLALIHNRKKGRQELLQ